MIVPASYSATQKVYSLDLASVIIEDHTPNTDRTTGVTGLWRFTIPAIWTSGSKARPAISHGQIWGYSKSPSLSDFMDTFDPRYGGQPTAKWDGTDFWSKDLSWDEMVEEQQFLDEVLGNLPSVPAGFTDWLTLKG